MLEYTATSESAAKAACAMTQSISFCSGSSALAVITAILFRVIISPHDYSIAHFGTDVNRKSAYYG